jgi:aromatic ring-opening dioxygenase catalytic subunit (LigB family)
MADYLRHVPEETGSSPPRALVVISGHWEESVVTIQNNPAPALLYDYYGFPPNTYQIKFPAPGAPEVSARVSELLEAAGIPWKYDHERGFDHGVFIPLKVAFPNANVPIVQVSLLANMDAAAHLRIGEALAPLRDEGVLIIGSGMTYHNMRTLMASMRRGANGRGADEGSQRFDDWLEEVLTKAPPESRARRRWPRGIRRPRRAMLIRAKSICCRSTSWSARPATMPANGPSRTWSWGPWNRPSASGSAFDTTNCRGNRRDMIGTALAL